MVSQQGLPEVGRIVEVTRGRERGLPFIVVGSRQDRFVLLADGQRRRVEQPKMKNVIHIRVLPLVATSIIEQLETEGKVTNAKLRFALRQYAQALLLESVAGNMEGGN